MCREIENGITGLDTDGKQEREMAWELGWELELEWELGLERELELGME